MTSEVVVGPGREVCRLAPAEGGGEGDADDASEVGGGEPALLVVVVAGQLPAVLLRSALRLGLLSRCIKISQVI